MAQKARNLLRSSLFVLCSLFLWSCGIENIPFVDPIPQGNITQAMNNRAVVRVSVDSPGTTFTNFSVFYRVYVSDTLQASTTTTSVYSAINSTLASDYNYFRNYIGSTTQVNVNMDSLFRNRGYKYLVLEDPTNNNINAILSESSFGQSLVFDFSSSKRPTMTLGNNTYVLWRSDGGGLFSPRPDRYFVNSYELSSPDNINDQINADVVNKAGLPEGGTRYTYAAMFIVAVGFNPSTYSNIYSTPSLIHVFLLPD
jgi:hypothetical protein